MEQTAARLRKTFHYPADNDSDDSLPEALDEEEQENLIIALQQKNKNLNSLYTQILLIFPLASIIPYLTTLLHPATTLPSLLSITSLLYIAYQVVVLPAGSTSIGVLDGLNRRPTGAWGGSASAKTMQLQYQGPIARYLPLLNAGLCIVLGLLGMVGRRKVWWGFGWLPGVVYAVVLTAKVAMGSVDPEAELGGLRYGLRGA